MTGLEVVGAVAAVVSAFHGGAELVAHLKKKHQKRKSSRIQLRQEFEEKQLQDSLETGETAVGQRYTADLRELGEIVRVGDAIARERLLHIAIVMQAEVIKSLQLAVTVPSAILNLQLLHEASVMNRRDSIVTLDEMKQRILITRPILRTLPGTPHDAATREPSISSAQTFQTAQSAPLPAVPDEYIPQAVTLSAAADPRDTKMGLARYFSMKRNNSQSSTSSSSHRSSTSSAASASFSPALNHLLQGKDRGAIMKDIDDIIASYQGLQTSDAKAESKVLYHEGGGTAKRNTLDILNGFDHTRRHTAALNREAQQILRNLPSTPEESNKQPEYPAFNYNVFDPSTQYHRTSDHLPPREPAQPQPTSSRLSESSSVYYDTVSPSPYSNNSRASFLPPTPPLISEPFMHSSSRSPNEQTAPPHHTHNALLPTTSTYPRQYSAPHPGYYTPQESHSPIKEEYGQGRGQQTQMRLAPKQSPVDTPLPVPWSSAQVWPPGAYVSEAVYEQVTALPPTGSPRPPSLDKTLSVSSSGSSTIRTGTIKGGVSAAQENMMDGFPNKGNNFWGFCKGAWSTREGLKKGLSVQARPVGMHNMREVWQCRECHFEGRTYHNTVPGKKKKETILDPNVHVSVSGVRYKWIFLAKSHAKKKTMSSVPVMSSEQGKEDCNYGCLICSVEGTVTSIYGNAETLMNHIFLEHGRSMEEKTASKSKCIVGRVAGDHEEWDLNIPLVVETIGPKPVELMA